jgi:hypothetical protein
MRFQFPRARGAAGGRAPQIGPGTLEGRTTANYVRPPEFSAVIYSPGSSGMDYELWCYRRPAGFHTLQEASKVWFDLVPESEAFVPPSDPIGFDVELALKAYARNRLLVSYQKPTTDDDWIVRATRPDLPQFPFPATSALKVGLGVFEIVQVDQDPLIPKAWVWVTASGHREIWLLYRPGEPGGYSPVGSEIPGTGQPHQMTELLFHQLSEDDNIDGIELNLMQLAASISTLRNVIQGRPDSPVVDPEIDLTIHNYYVLSDPSHPSDPEE